MFLNHEYQSIIPNYNKTKTHTHINRIVGVNSLKRNHSVLFISVRHVFNVYIIELRSFCCFLIISFYFIFPHRLTVVSQYYDTDVNKAYVIRGNSGILKCEVCMQWYAF